MNEEKLKIKKIKKKKKSKNKPILLFRNIARTIKLYWKIDRKGLIICASIVIVQAFLPAINSYFWGQSVNKVIEYTGGNHEILNSAYWDFGLGTLATILIFYLWEAFDYFNKMSWYTWHEYMYVAVPRKISSLDTEKFEDPKFKNLMNKVSQGYGHRPANFAEKMLWTLNGFIAVITSIGIIATFNIVLFPIIVFSLLPGIYVLFKSGKQAYGIWDAKGDISRMAGNNSWYLANDNYVKEIKIFRLQKYILGILENLFKDFQSGFRKNERKTFAGNLITRSLEEGTNIGIKFWLLNRVLFTTNFGIGDFTFINSSISELTGSLRNFLRNISQMYNDNLFMTDLFKLFDTENKMVSKENATKIESTNVPKIEFRNVSFCYPRSEKKVFDHLNIIINPGEDIALVGENGAGKTTFVKLLLRFYDVTEGQILINDIDIRDIDLDTYYKNIGVLFQEFNQYYYSVTENIAVGDTEREIDQEEIEEKSKQSGSHNFVSEYKKGYEQILNTEFKAGIEPSGGQWQRIALARAFYRNANILILDEPTSAIDAKGEYEIFKEIEKVQKEKTTIIISHRFSTVRNANKIYVIEDGKILESGTHEELMLHEKGKYKEMFELQAEGYK